MRIFHFKIVPMSMFHGKESPMRFFSWESVRWEFSAKEHIRWEYSMEEQGRWDILLCNNSDGNIPRKNTPVRFFSLQHRSKWRLCWHATVNFKCTYKNVNTAFSYARAGCCLELDLWSSTWSSPGLKVRLHYREYKRGRNTWNKNHQQTKGVNWKICISPSFLRMSGMLIISGFGTIYPKTEFMCVLDTVLLVSWQRALHDATEV